MTTIIDDITFEEDFKWSDRFANDQISHEYKYSLTGALIITASTRLKGREITLESGDNWGVIEKSELDLLIAKKEIPGYQFDVDINGDVFTVQFRHSENAIEAEPLVFPDNVPGCSKFKVKLKLIEV